MRTLVVGLALGLAAGLVIGLVVGGSFLSSREPARAREVVRYLPPPLEEGYDEPEDDEPFGRDEIPPPAGGGAEAITAERVRAADDNELRRMLVERDAPIAPGAVEALIARLDQAREERDWTRFRTLLSLLGRADTAAAHEKLVAVMGDESLGFHRSALGQQFFQWLEGAEVPGLVEAARVRLEKEVAENPGSPGVERGWLALIAKHGTAGDLDWIERRARDAGRGGEREVIEAFVAAADRPDVAQRVKRLFEEPENRWFSGHLREFARNNPDAAIPLLEKGLRDPKRGEARDLARVYGETVRPAEVEQARRFLLGLETEEQRMAAVYAVEKMKRNGLDVSGLESLAVAPVEALERFASNPQAINLYEARYAIERNPIAWTERAARALEEAAEHAPKSQAAGLRNAARRVRAGLGTADSEWVTR